MSTHDNRDFVNTLRTSGDDTRLVRKALEAFRHSALGSEHCDQDEVAGLSSMINTLWQVEARLGKMQAKLS